ncbi:TonB-dependent receptor [Burkholderia sp. Ax-1724]|nr:TonB-dependent receptor [Burkholderia sp. Ax-1724]
MAPSINFGPRFSTGKQGHNKMQQLLSPFRMKPLTQCVLAALCMSGIQFAHAQEAGDLGSVQSTATSSSPANAPTGSKNVQTAPAQAPTQGSLTATEPQSTISHHYIQNSTAPTENYSDIMNIAPSVSSISPNGPGLMESPTMSIRGFQDGQYNVTFDGIPFGDANNFTHHSTSFFSSQAINRLTVDRGPGDASQIGFATFGGTIAMESLIPSMTPSAALLGTYGSYNTWLAGAELNTGDLQQLGDARATFGYTQSSSDGYLTGASQRRENAYFKFEKPLGDSTVLTLFGTYNKIHQNTPYGSSAAQIAEFGPNYGLSSNPLSQAYSGYNYDLVNTDFEYIGVQTKVAQWAIDNKLYTYGYYHTGFQGVSPNSSLPYNAFSTKGPYLPAGNVAGQEQESDYRAWGDVVRAQRDIGPGSLEFGAWFAYQTNFRDRVEANATQNFAFVAPMFSMTNTLTTFQPYIQYAWKLPYGFTVTPGVKYALFRRDLYSAMNQGSGLPADYGQTWTKVLPSLQIHEKINSNWSAYAQYAQGFLAPNLNTFNIPNLTANSQPDPQRTDNYQIGTTYKTDRLTASVDLYYIKFANEITSVNIGGNTFYSNAGAATYKGIETEATYYAGLGFSLYGNLTFNSAKQHSDNSWMPFTPNKTAAAGLLYERGPLTGSLITKFIGRQYGTTGNQIPIGGFAQTDLSVGYTFKPATSMVHDVRVGLQLDNLFNRTGINGFFGFGADAAKTPLYWTQAGRSVFGTVQVDF